MTSRVLAFAAEEVPPLHHNELPMPHWMYGAIALAVFMLMFGVLWSFRNTAPKMSEQHDAHGSQHAHGSDVERPGH
ncbi:hypothetical protein [Yimella sp. cx-51]|uniref:hypothetical protein n=1 Tax=Yimella sp. cx-51 TaxID=2770551 RepID=UPI00165DA33F|nr:hypothetical protein [Yimella sp. cx-51]MBC9956867.1 hypothetical protein [Yimella sp. cx-51]MBD2760198.1 hypothetical protein [Yimella sp. cx-573]QTH39093.1 hypothetical protein J5M86_05570 [Yimella sp. cx-51]